MARKGRVQITLREESYWKLEELKVRLRCRTWDEFAEKIHELVSNCGGEDPSRGAQE